MGRSGIAVKFNRGEVSSDALVRIDVDRIRESCSYMENFLPKRLGPMQYRPGMENLGAAAGQAYTVPFQRAIDDTAVLEFSNNLMRVWVDDALITRTAVTSTITNGTFTSDITGWIDDSETGASLAWFNYFGDPGLGLTGTGTTAAIAYQTVASTDTGNEHALRVVVAMSPVEIMIGYTGSESSEIYKGMLGPGAHSLVFTPTSNITITFRNTKKYRSVVTTVGFEAAGTMTLPTDVTTALLSSIRFTQSADVLFMTAGKTVAPFMVERRGTKSWSVVEYQSEDGPFLPINATSTTLTPTALSGDTLLTASTNYFKSTMIGSLRKLVSSGQTVTTNVSAEDNGTNEIRVIGVDSARAFQVSVTGTFSATVTLQRSADQLNWEDVTTYTSTTIASYDDTLDNSILYYRLHVKTGDYTSGTAVLKLTYAAGSIEGICRIYAIVSESVAQIQVLTDFGSTSATRDWYEGELSELRGYPSGVELYDGRLWFGAPSRVFGSVSDAYTSNDADIEGDSAAIQKTVGFGPVESPSWLKAASRLIMGIPSNEISIRSSSFNEPMTPSNTNLRQGSSQGSANIDSVVVDSDVFFVQNSERRLFKLEYNPATDAYGPSDLNILHPDLFDVDIIRIAVARQPETRVWAVLSDGTARVLLIEPTENIMGWTRVSTDGLIEDVCTVIRKRETSVYFIVNRGGTRYLEKMAMMSEALGSTISKHLDSFKTFTSPGLTLTGLSHLNGKNVRVWADGADVGQYTVASGQVTLNASYTNVVCGQQFNADWISNRIAAYSDIIDVNEYKRVATVGLVLSNYLHGNVKVGSSFGLLRSMNPIQGGRLVTGDAVGDFDYRPFGFNGGSESNPRIYLRATGPVTVKALTYELDDENG